MDEKSEREREREQTDRQTARETGRQRERETCIQALSIVFESGKGSKKS